MVRKLIRSWKNHILYFAEANHLVKPLYVVTWEENYVPYELVGLGEMAMKENLVLLTPFGNVLIKR